jgi:hypothetical protein
LTTLNRRKRGLPYRIVWYDPQPKFRPWPPTIYYHSSLKDPVPGLVRKPFWTLLVDLSVDEAALMAGLNGTTRTQVRQAEKLGIVCGPGTAETFLPFFEEFAKEKGIEGTSPEKLESFGTSLRVTEARLDGVVLAMHVWLLDADLGRLRLIHSATGRFADPEHQNASGRANRLLHWWEMVTFRAQGVRTYDWGGYAKDTEDQAKKGINQFKDGFGGSLVEESHYYPFYLSGFRD